jgi:hypothetical protein
MDRPYTLSLAAGLLLAFASSTYPGQAQSSQTTDEPQRRFGGTYDLLEPEQRRLIDDWVRRFSEVTGRSVPPDVLYNVIRLSTRTTFDAVTHALLTTSLTDESGKSLGPALDLVEHMETIKGKVKGESGDRQFRMYAALKPDAKEILKKSREFKRDADNTIYHKGYPINYRQTGRIPSIQISVARETNRADIDVDYRSPGFPQALFNGHLSSSNSDVRAGNNHQRHVNRWGAGLEDWWRGLFGLPIRVTEGEQSISEAEFIPDHPPAGKLKLQEAVYDFLKNWLVDAAPNVAMSYVSDRAYECLQLNQETPVDRGMAPAILTKGMGAVNEALGKVSSLDAVTVGVRLNDPALKVVENRYHAQFVLYDVPADVATSFECINRTKAVAETSAKGPRRYGEYYGSIFYIGGPVRGETVALLWAKEGGYWKIISYETEVEGEDPDVPDIRPTETVEIKRTEGDPRLITVAEDFHRSWLIDKNAARAFDYLSPRAYSCYNYLRTADRPEAKSTEEAARYILQGMERVGRDVPEISSLEEIMEAVETVDPQLLVVTHPHESFTLVAGPDHLGEAADCAKRAQGVDFPEDEPSIRDYGNYFATGFKFRVQRGRGSGPGTRVGQRGRSVEDRGV